MKLLSRYVLVVLGVLVLLMGWGYWSTRPKGRYDTYQAKAVDIQLIGQDYVFTSGWTKTSQRYIAFEKAHYLWQRNPNDPSPSPVYGDKEFHQVMVYDLDRPDFAPRSLEVLELLKKQGEKYYRPVGIDIVQIANIHYLSVYLIKYETDDYSERIEQTRFINLETGKLVEEDLSDPSSPKKHPPLDFTGKIRDGFNELMRERFNATISISGDEGYVISNLYDEDDQPLDLSGTNFEKLYPDIASKFKNTSELYMRPDSYTPEVWFDTLLYWFAPAGEEALEFYVTDADTGEKSRFKRYEEYRIWLETHRPERYDFEE